MKRPITILERISCLFSHKSGVDGLKNFLLIVFGLICIAFLIAGNQYWQEKVSGSPSSPETGSPEAETPAAEAQNTGALTSNWPVNARTSFDKAIEDGRTFKLALVGSPALGADANGWSEQLKEEMAERFGKALEVSIFESDSTSVEFIGSDVYEDVLDVQPDLVLFEPFTLIDNSIGVPFERNHESILSFNEELKKANSGVELILQPPYPIAGATYYPKQVEKLKEFAEDNGFTYLDHWKAWPVEDELEGYLTSSQEAPNEEGHALWAEYMIDYFIAE
jgi:hypothetical protein